MSVNKCPDCGKKSVEIYPHNDGTMRAGCKDWRCGTGPSRDTEAEALEAFCGRRQDGVKGGKWARLAQQALDARVLVLSIKHDAPPCRHFQVTKMADDAREKLDALYEMLRDSAEVAEADREDKCES